jgi:hypothetical protein
VPLQGEEDRPGEQVIAAWEDELAVPLLDRMEEGRGIVGLAISPGPEVAYRTHSPICEPTTHR